MLRFPPARLSRMIRKSSIGDVGELRAAGAFSDGPDPGRTRLQPLVDANIATIVQLDAGLLEPDPGGVRDAPRRDQDVAALDGLLAGGRAHDKADVLSGSAAAPRSSCAPRESQFLRHPGIRCISSATSRSSRLIELRPMLDDRHAAAEAAIGLRQFEADIAAAEHDQMWRHIVEFRAPRYL